MSEPSDKPVPYKVSYSERVRVELRTLLKQATARGLGARFLNALKEVDQRLHIYPQFGEPLRDLKTAGATLRIGTCPPFVVRYMLDEERRLVFVGIPFKVLAGSGL